MRTWMMLMAVMIGSHTYLAYADTLPPKPEAAPAIQEALANLPQEKIELIKNTMKSLKEEQDKAQPEIKQLNDELQSLLLAPQFNQDAFVLASDRLNALHSKRFKTRTQLIVDLANQLTVEERAAIIQFLPKNKPTPTSGQALPAAPLKQTLVN